MNKIKYILLGILLQCSILSIAQQKRDLLQKSTAGIEFEKLFSRQTIDYPAYADRVYWDTIPGDLRKRAIRAAEKSVEQKLSMIPLTSYLEYVRIGDRARCDALNGKPNTRLSNLILGELIEGKGRFLDAIADQAWALCERSTWVGTAHLASQKKGAGVPDINDVVIDLNSGETSTLMAWTHYFFKKNLDAISPLIAERIKQEITERTITPFLKRDNYWWQGFRGNFVNNWNIWCNYNVLMSTLLIEENPKIKTEVIRKSLRSVDQFINYYKEDGGCDEGPSYWDHAPGKLMEYLEIVKKITGEQANLFREPLIQKMGKYIAHMHIDSCYFVNFADASAIGHSVPTIIYRYGKNCGDTALMQFGRYMGELSGATENPLQGSITMKLMNLFSFAEFKATEPRLVRTKSTWLDGIQVAVARDQTNGNKGLFFAAKGGYNNESHNHNDAGSFILYKDGAPMIIDAGVGTYTAKTFSNDRYKLWPMQSSWHNLPLINGSIQGFGTQYRAKNVKFADTGKRLSFTLDIANAYPKEAACNQWTRTYTLERGKHLTIEETYQLKQIKGETTLHYLTACEIKEIKPGLLELTNRQKRLLLKYDPKQLDLSFTPPKMDDARLQKIWGEKITRIELKIRQPTQEGQIKVRFE